jgi:hypothetical protein
MSAPNPSRQRSALKLLDGLFHDPKNVFFIHYSCESFYDRPQGRSARVTSIAVRNLASGQTKTFSIHKSAEEKEVPFAEIDACYDNLEKDLLKNYFSHISKMSTSWFVHWNMRDENYGFSAIEHRGRVLGVKPEVVSDDRKLDLSRTLIDIYGTGYIGHPRLETLLAKNDVRPLDFLSGKAEAEAFEKKEYWKLHLSTLRKVDVLADVATRAHDRHLKTETKWWALHGGRLRDVVEWMTIHPYVVAAAIVTGLTGFAITLWQIS